MIRMTLLVLAIASAVPLSPMGCPPTDTTGDGNAVERGVLAVSVQAPDAATVGQTVVLQAAAVANDNSGTIRHSWLQIGGPGVQLANVDQASASFVAPSLNSRQTIAVMVTAHDEAGAVGRAVARVTVDSDPNYTPYNWGSGHSGGGTATGAQADAGVNRTVSPGDDVTLDGSGSSGANLSYRWRQISGTTVTLSQASTVAATFTAPAYAESGDNHLTFELAVTDGSGRTSTDRVRINVRNPSASDRQVRVETTMGSFVIDLDPDAAPVTVENFLQYVDDEFYDGTIFHRVISGFVVQGGGLLPGMTQKETRAPIVNESDNGLLNVRASVAMARTSQPDSATSQFYVNLVDNSFLDYQEGTPGYTVFGRVSSGMDVVDTIAQVQTTTRSGYQDVPVNDVVITSIRRVSTSGPIEITP